MIYVYSLKRFYLTYNSLIYNQNVGTGRVFYFSIRDIFILKTDVK